MKVGAESSIDLDSLVNDVDNTDSEVTVIVSSPDEAGGAQYNRQTGMLKLKFNEVGNKNVIIKVVDTYSSNEYTTTIEVYDSDVFTIAKYPSTDGFMVVNPSNMYIGQLPIVNMYLTDDAPLFTSLSVRWQTCSNEGVCNGIWIYDLDMTKSTSGWETELRIPNAADPSVLARPYGYNYGDYFYLMIDGVDNLNNNYKTTRAIEPLYKWIVTQDLPPASQMDDEMIVSHIANLNMKIENVEEQLLENPSADLELQLIDLEFQLELACLDPRVTCTEDETSGTSTDESTTESNTILIAGVVIAIIIVALLGGMFLLRGRGDEEIAGFKWANTTLPAQDAIANSMYGGTQQIFQQPLPTPQNYQQYQPPYYANQHQTTLTAPVQPAPPQNIPQAPIAQGPPITQDPPITRGPPLPPGGLPAGWSMDQWEYYSQQYLERLQG